MPDVQVRSRMVQPRGSGGGVYAAPRSYSVSGQQQWGYHMTCSNAVGAATISSPLVDVWGIYQLVCQKVSSIPEFQLVGATGTAVLRDNEEYNPDMVAEILAADAAPPEEPSFDNVVDLLEWLNRD